MASFLRTSVTTVAQTLVGAETGFITSNGGVVTTGSDAITATTGTNWVNNDGYIFAQGGGFAAIDADGGVFELLNGLNGFISTENSSQGTLDLDLTTLAQIVNHGIIHSPNSSAISFGHTDGSAIFSLQNTGSITANDSNAIFTSVGTGRHEIFNSGLISAEGDTLDLNGANLSSTTHSLHNTGTISATNGQAIDFSLGDFAIMRITNSGTISATQEAIFTSNNNTAVVINTGIIQTSGNLRAIYLDDGNDIVRNSGLIVGNVDLYNGTDFLDNRGGVINGEVDGHGGNDTLLGGSEGDDFLGGTGSDLLVGHGGDDTLRGDIGFDTLLGGAGDDSLDGGTEDDTLNGQDGDDTLEGGDGNDAMTGGAGSDEMLGGADNDTMNGQDGEDVLEGEAGNDILRGGNGDDALAGGEGFDLLTGGQGFDTFVFRALSETAPGANRDQILDFEQGIDLIVVAGLSPGVFEFRGTAAFAPSGNSELRLFETPTGSTIVQIDADGNGTIDAEIRVANVTGLTAEDFVL